MQSALNDAKPEATSVPPPMPTSDPKPETERMYHAVPIGRFVFMFLITGGLYIVYWSMKNWRYIKERDESDIWPFWRGVFSLIWMYQLVADVEKTEGHEQAKKAGSIAAAFVLLEIAGNKLPDPY